MADQSKGMSDLWRRLRFVFLAIVVYRMGTHIPIPGIDPARLAALFDQNQGTILEMFNLFSGGALERMSIFALNVVPYISAAIIMQLFSNSIPYLQELKKDGQAGRNQITQYTRYGTVASSAFSVDFIIVFFEVFTNFSLIGRTDTSAIVPPAFSMDSFAPFVTCTPDTFIG